MFRYFKITLLLLSTFPVFSQSYIGFEADNFNGVHGVLSNPANIADSRTKVDINLASISSFTTNTYMEIEYFNLLTKDPDDFLEQSSYLGRDKINYGVLNVDVLGPSAMVSLSEKHSIAITTRARSITNANNIHGEVIEFFETENLNEIEDITQTNINGSFVNNNWLEIGATYARVLNDDKVHFFKGGVTLKYLMGYGSFHAKIDDALVFYADAQAGTNVTTFGNASYNYSKNFDINENFEPFDSDSDTEWESETRGLGLDIGLVYEYRPNHRQNISKNNVKDQKVIRHKSTYKYKIGFSIMDIGAMTYKQSFETTANLNGNTDINTLLGGDFESEIKPSFLITESRTDQKILLPTNIRAEFDLKLNEKIYLNASSRLSVFSKDNDEATRYANQVTISPRFETKWITAYSPLTYTQFGGIQWGVGGRIGPVFIGSSSAISHILIDDQTRAFDLYAGIKIPIFHKTPPPPPEDDPVSGFQSNCNDCNKGKKAKKPKRVESYRGPIK